MITVNDRLRGISDEQRNRNNNCVYSDNSFTIYAFAPVDAFEEAVVANDLPGKRVLATLLKFEESNRALENALFGVQLDNYASYAERRRQIEAVCPAPHGVLLLLATHYLAKLDPLNPEHGEAIEAIGGVIEFAGRMACLYRPDDCGNPATVN